MSVAQGRHCSAAAAPLHPHVVSVDWLGCHRQLPQRWASVSCEGGGGIQQVEIPPRLHQPPMPVLPAGIHLYFELLQESQQ